MKLKRGDVGLARFPHLAGTRGKKRPVVVVQADAYNATVAHVIVAEVTSNLAAGRRHGVRERRAGSSCDAAGGVAVRGAVLALGSAGSRKCIDGGAEPDNLSRPDSI